MTTLPRSWEGAVGSAPERVRSLVLRPELGSVVAAVLLYTFFRLRRRGRCWRYRRLRRC